MLGGFIYCWSSDRGFAAPRGRIAGCAPAAQPEDGDEPGRARPRSLKADDADKRVAAGSERVVSPEAPASGNRGHCPIERNPVLTDEQGQATRAGPQGGLWPITVPPPRARGLRPSSARASRGSHDAARDSMMALRRTLPHGDISSHEPSLSSADRRPQERQQPKP